MCEEPLYFIQKGRSSMADDNQSASLISTSFVLKTETGCFVGVGQLFSFSTNKLVQAASLGVYACDDRVPMLKTFVEKLPILSISGDSVYF